MPRQRAPDPPSDEWTQVIPLLEALSNIKQQEPTSEDLQTDQDESAGSRSSEWESASEEELAELLAPEAAPAAPAAEGAAENAAALGKHTGADSTSAKPSGQDSSAAGSTVPEAVTDTGAGAATADADDDARIESLCSLLWPAALKNRWVGWGGG